MAEKKKRKKREHPLFEYEYEEEITYECPVRGLVKQKVKIKRYKTRTDKERLTISEEKDELEVMLEEAGMQILEADE